MTCKCNIERKQLFGSPADMGTLDDIRKEIDEREAEEKALAEAEAEEAADALKQERMKKRGNRGLKKFQ